MSFYTLRPLAAKPASRVKSNGTYLKARELARGKFGWGEGLPVEIRLV
jgi:hypothetical protein